MAFEAARRRVAELLPSAPLDAATASLARAIDAAAGRAAAAAAAAVNAEGGPVDAAATAMRDLAARVREAEASFAAATENVTLTDGPLAQSVLGAVRVQVRRGGRCAQRDAAEGGGRARFPAPP